MDDSNMDLTYSESIRLICAFKKHGILWNPHVRGYHNRENKDEAWKIIAAESSIHPDVCRRKMKSLVSSCRREKIKIIKSRSSGRPEDVYDPKWRYWNAFKFLRGLEDDDEDPLGTAPEQDTTSARDVTPWSTSKMLAHKHRNAQMPPVPPKPSSSSSMRQSSPEQPTMKEKDDEYTAIGITVEAKLRKMSYDQKLFAENIINQALYKGLLFQLTELSEIRTTDFPAGYYSPKPKAGLSKDKPQKLHISNSDGESLARSIKRSISESSNSSGSDGEPISKLKYSL